MPPADELGELDEEELDPEEDPEDPEDPLAESEDPDGDAPVVSPDFFSPAEAESGEPSAGFEAEEPLRLSVR